METLATILFATVIIVSFFVIAPMGLYLTDIQVKLKAKKPGEFFGFAMLFLWFIFCLLAPTLTFAAADPPSTKIPIYCTCILVELLMFWALYKNLGKLSEKLKHLKE